MRKKNSAFCWKRAKFLSLDKLEIQLLLDERISRPNPRRVNNYLRYEAYILAELLDDLQTDNLVKGASAQASEFQRIHGSFNTLFPLLVLKSTIISWHTLQMKISSSKWCRTLKLEFCFNELKRL